MPELIAIERAAEITDLATELMAAVTTQPVDVQRLLSECQRWSEALLKAEARSVPGIAFLSMWLRRNTLEPLVKRELGEQGLSGQWASHGQLRDRFFPLGVVGHWSASNVEVLPFLSITSSLLGGNSVLVRIPPAAAETTKRVLAAVAGDGEEIARHARFITFAHDRRDLQEAMARGVQGAVIWGGQEAVLSVRALPFVHATRFQIFGPRDSACVMDAGAWLDENARQKWCLRLARDVWQFDQRACSSPQVLFVEADPGGDMSQLGESIRQAFREENRLHPRVALAPSTAAAVARARAECLLEAPANRGWFPSAPDWSILLHHQLTRPSSVQGRTLHVVPTDDLLAAVNLLDENTQTLGLAFANREKEVAVVEAAGRRGIDRLVRLGTMHVFDSPWDGMELIKPMVRKVRYGPCGPVPGPNKQGAKQNA